MLDDELTLLDGTEVVSTKALARLTGMNAQWVGHRLWGVLEPETNLEGVYYFERESALRLVAGRQ